MALNTAALVPSATSYSPLKKKGNKKLIRSLRLRRIYYIVHKEKKSKDFINCAPSKISYSPLKMEAYFCSFLSKIGSLLENHSKLEKSYQSYFGWKPCKS